MEDGDRKMSWYEALPGLAVEPQHAGDSDGSVVLIRLERVKGKPGQRVLMLAQRAGRCSDRLNAFVDRG